MMVVDHRTIRLAVVPARARRRTPLAHGCRVQTFNVDSYGWRLVVERYRSLRRAGATVQSVRGLIYFTLDAAL